jgi:hypothetical protein
MVKEREPSAARDQNVSMCATPASFTLASSTLKGRPAWADTLNKEIAKRLMIFFMFTVHFKFQK